MKTIIVTGTVINGNGCAVSVILFSGSTVLSIHHYHSSFQDSYSVAPGAYTISTQGITGGTLRFTVTAGPGTTMIPPIDVSFKNQVSGSFNFQVS